MSDLELLELAAKAAGYESQGMEDGRMYLFGIQDGWNPLTDDGDALRLAVKLELTEVWFDKSTGRPEVVCGKHGTGICVEPLRDDPCAATRRAIVRAAAESGKALTATPTAPTPHTKEPT